MSATTTGNGHVTPRTVLVCHAYQAIGEAIAAAITRGGAAQNAIVVTSCDRVISSLDRGPSAAVLCDVTSDDVAELSEAMSHRGYRIPQLVMVPSPTAAASAELLDAGACGVLPISSPTKVLCRAVDAIERGVIAVPVETRSDVMRAWHLRRVARYEARRRLAGLTRAQLQVLRGLADGVSVGDMARESGVSYYTVRSRIVSTGRKLGVTGQLRLAAVGRELLAACEPPPAGRVVVANVARGRGVDAPTAAVEDDTRVLCARHLEDSVARDRSRRSSDMTVVAGRVTARPCGALHGPQPF